MAANGLPEPGGGWTTEPLSLAVVKETCRQYDDGLRVVGVKPAKRQALMDGHRDGLRATVQHQEGMGVLAVYPDDREQ